MDTDTDRPSNVTQPTVSGQLPEEVEQALAGGLGELTLRQLLAWLLSCLGQGQRKVYLDQAPRDKGNGSYLRSLMLGSLPLEVEVPRTRQGAFRPSFLPPPYQRGYSEEFQALLMNLLTSSRSLKAAKTALQQMGVPCSESELENLSQAFQEELQLRNSRPLESDWLALFLDAKWVEVRQGDRLRPACLYLAVGLGRDGRKRMLACRLAFGAENLEEWKSLLRDLIERGLRRLLLVIQDDFSGLRATVESFFPKAQVQLCIVHLQRNARRQLPKAQATLFQQRLRAIKAAWDPEQANQQFQDLCQLVAPAASHFAAELRKKRPYYLAFLHYPPLIRRTFSTTNAVEVINGQLERLRRNNGGYFHSLQILQFKLGITLSQLENGTWKRTSSSIAAVLDELNSMFRSRFQLDPQTAQTQDS